MKAADHRKAVLPQTGSHHDLLFLESSFNATGCVGQNQERYCSLSMASLLESILKQVLQAQAQKQLGAAPYELLIYC